jgi:hypothetical protein
MKKRNKEANCGNCPYGQADINHSDAVFCQKHAIDETWGRDRRISKDEWCGEHPDFWEEAPAEMPDWLSIVAVLFDVDSSGSVCRNFVWDDNIERAILAMLKAAGRIPA